MLQKQSFIVQLSENLYRVWSRDKVIQKFPLGIFKNYLNSSVILQNTLAGHILSSGALEKPIPQSSSTLWNYSKCGIYTVESEAGC
jgi:hypothetical protein